MNECQGVSDCDVHHDDDDSQENVVNELRTKLQDADREMSRRAELCERLSQAESAVKSRLEDAEKKVADGVAMVETQKAV